VGGLSLQDAVRGGTPEEIKAALRRIDKTIFEKIAVPSIDVDAPTAAAMKNGKPLQALLSQDTLPKIVIDDAPLAVFCADELVALLIRGADMRWRYGCVA
jgi:hypothetical protein